MWNWLNAFSTSPEACRKMMMWGASKYQNKSPGLSFREALELSLTRTRPPWNKDPALINGLREALDRAGPGISETEMASLAVEVEEQYNYGKPAEWGR